MRLIILGIIGVFAVLALTAFIDLQGVANIILGVNILFLLGAVCIQLLSYAFLTKKLHSITKQYKTISYLAAFKVWLMGALLDLVTPFIQIGGEPLKILMLKKNKINTAKASAIVITDTFVELFAFFTMLVVAILLLMLSNTTVVSTSTYLAALIISAILISGMFYVVLNKNLLKKIAIKTAFITKRFGISVRKIEKTVSSFEVSFRKLLHKEGLMVETFSLSIGAKLLDFSRVYLVFLAIGFPIGLDVIVFAWAIILIFSMLPGLPGNLGIVEAGGIAAYVLFGVPAPIAAAVVILDRLISFWMLVGIGGAVFLPKKK